MKLRPGEVLAEHYEIRAELGEGGFGTVYRAFDQTLRREVALKILKSTTSPGGDDYSRFMRESKYLARLSHPNIVQVFAVELLNNTTPFIVMEFVAGVSLKALLTARDGKLSAAEVKSIFVQICSALSEAHKQGIVHRDLSSANILLVDSNGEHLVKIIDFGLSKVDQSQEVSDHNNMATKALTRAGSLIGNPRYMSPEACRGEAVDPSSDIYSLGCLLYEMIAGKVPFDSAEPLGILYKHQNEFPYEPQLSWENPDQEVLYKELCLRCMQKDKDKRPKVDDLLAILGQSVKLGSLLQRGYGWRNESRRSKGFASGLSPAVVLLACVFVVTGSLVWYKLNRESQVKAESIVVKQDSKSLELKNLLSNVKQKRARYGNKHEALIEPLFALGEFYYLHQDSDKAIEQLGQVYSLMRQNHIFVLKQGQTVYDVLRLLSSCRFYKAEPEKSEELDKQALKLIAETEGKENANYVIWLSRLGKICEYEQKYSEAENYYLESIAQAESTDEQTLADAEFVAGNFYLEQKRPVEAFKFLKKAQHLAEELSHATAQPSPSVRLLGTKVFENNLAKKGDEVLFDIYSSLSTYYFDQGELKKSEEFLLKSLNFIEHSKNLIDRTTQKVRFLKLLAERKMAQGQKSSANSLLDEAQDIIDKSFTSEAAKSWQLRELASSWAKAKDYSKAISLYQQAAQIAEKTKDYAPWKKLEIKENLAFCFLKSGDSKKANDLYKQLESTDSNQSSIGDHWHEGLWRSHFALSYVRLNDNSAAEKYYIQALKEMKQCFPLDRREIQCEQFDLAKIYAQQKRSNEAELYLKDAVENAFKIGDKTMLRDTAVFASTFYRKNKIDLAAAESILTRALSYFNDHGSDRVLKQDIYRALSDCALDQGRAEQAKDYTRSAQRLNL